MHHLNPYLNLTTGLIVSGLMILTVNPAKAQSWERTLYLSNDSYSDTNNPGTNFGDSDFIQVGNFDSGFGSGDEQRGYLSWNLESLLQDIPLGSRVRNLSATLIMTQSNSDPTNPNDFNLSDPDNPVPISRRFPGVARVTLDGLDVTGAWDESSPINPAAPPSSVPVPTLFSGQIDQGTNRYRGIGLNRLITDVLNSNLNADTSDDRDVLSIALRANNSLNFPSFGVSPIDSFWSRNQENIDFQPQLEISFDVWNEAHRITDGANFSFQSRGGGDSNVNDSNSNGDWEISLLTKSIENGQNKDNPVDQNDPDRQLTWASGVNVPFELFCNTATNRVTLTLNNDPSRTTEFTANSCQDIDGLKLFAKAQQSNEVTAGTTMRIRVNQVREVGGTLQPVRGLEALSRAIQGNPQTGVDDFFYFLDSTEQGGLGFTNGIDLMQGDLRLIWPNGNFLNNPQRKNPASLIQTQLVPLKKINDPNPDPSNDQPIPPEANQPAPAPACSVLVPDEVWLALTADGSSFTVDQSICSDEFTPAQTVPEPNSILSFILLGTTGLGVRLLKKRV